MRLPSPKWVSSHFTSLAAQIALALDTQGLAKVEVAGPFLNFTRDDALIQRVARDVLLAGDAFGRARKPSGRSMIERP